MVASYAGLMFYYEDVFIEIMTRMDMETIYKVALTCKKAYSILISDKFWVRYYFPMDLPISIHGRPIPEKKRLNYYKTLWKVHRMMVSLNAYLQMCRWTIYGSRLDFTAGSESCISVEYLGYFDCVRVNLYDLKIQFKYHGKMHRNIDLNAEKIMNIVESYHQDKHPKVIYTDFASGIWAKQLEQRKYNIERHKDCGLEFGLPWDLIYHQIPPIQQALFEDEDDHEYGMFDIINALSRRSSSAQFKVRMPKEPKIDPLDLDYSLDHFIKHKPLESFLGTRPPPE